MKYFLNIEETEFYMYLPDIMSRDSKKIILNIDVTLNFTVVTKPVSHGVNNEAITIVWSLLVASTVQNPILCR